MKKPDSAFAGSACQRCNAVPLSRKRAHSAQRVGGGRPTLELATRACERLLKRRLDIGTVLMLMVAHGPASLYSDGDAAEREISAVIGDGVPLQPPLRLMTPTAC